MRTITTLVAVLCFGVTSFAQVGFTQEGLASFYADKFEGRTTASGEKYSHIKATCAHLTLPFGTLVKVTSIRKGISIVVRVNDRGPFVPDRIIDLSRSAAEKLGFISEGVERVRIEVIDSAGQPYFAKNEPANFPQPPVQPELKPIDNNTKTTLAESAAEIYELKAVRVKPGGFSIQVGSYKELANLLRIADDLRGTLKKEIKVQIAQVNGEKLYRLMVGEFSTKHDAELFKEKVAKVYPACFVVEVK